MPADNSQYLQRVNEHYNEKLVTNSALQNPLTHLYLASRAGIQPGDYVLDVGCGVGNVAINIAQSIPDVRFEGITISEGQAQTAQELAQQAGLSDRVRVQVGDYHYLPFADQIFDVVICIETVFHSYNPQQLFQEIYRVLRPGGKLYIREFFVSESPLSEQQQQDLEKYQQIGAGQFRPMSELTEIVSTAGFQELQTSDMTGIIPTDTIRMAMLSVYLPNLPLLLGDIRGIKPTASGQSPVDSSQYQQTVGDYYDENVGKESELSSLAASSNLYLASRAGIQPGNYVIDVGCGVGQAAIDIAQSIPEVRFEGITISEAEAQKAQQLVQQAGLSDRVRVQAGDYHYLPFAEKVFDVVFCIQSVSYSDNLQQMFQEVYRVLRPGGTLYIEDVFISESPLSEQQQQEAEKFYQLTLVPLRHMSEFTEAIRLAGFQELQTSNLTGIIPIDNLKMAGVSAKCPNLPILFAEIKATKPVAVPVTTDQISPVSSEMPNALNSSTNSVTASQAADAVTASLPSNLVYALGTLGYDFGTEARRDSFKQFMPAVEVDNTGVPANPYDARQMVDYLEQNLSEAKSLIWTLNLELTPIYAIEPVDAFAADVYETLQQMLAGQVQAQTSEDYIERVSIPGRLTGKTVKLFSGQLVPVIKPQATRGMYGWKVNTLVSAALATVETQEQADEEAMRRSLGSFLNRIYYDLRNLGQIARDRALNFAATNAFQAASTFAEAVARGMELDSIEIEKSPFCRLDSDCWDVKLKFFDPENSERAKKVFRFTIDVIDIVPVTLGDVKTWSVPY